MYNVGGNAGKQRGNKSRREESSASPAIAAAHQVDGCSTRTDVQLSSREPSPARRRVARLTPSKKPLPPRAARHRHQRAARVRLGNYTGPAAEQRGKSGRAARPGREIRARSRDAEDALGSPPAVSDNFAGSAPGFFTRKRVWQMVDVSSFADSLPSIAPQLL